MAEAMAKPAIHDLQRLGHHRSLCLALPQEDKEETALFSRKAYSALLGFN